MDICTALRISVLHCGYFGHLYCRHYGHLCCMEDKSTAVLNCGHLYCTAECGHCAMSTVQLRCPQCNKDFLDVRTTVQMSSMSALQYRCPRCPHVQPLQLPLALLKVILPFLVNTTVWEPLRQEMSYGHIIFFVKRHNF